MDRAPADACGNGSPDRRPAAPLVREVGRIRAGADIAAVQLGVPALRGAMAAAERAGGDAVSSLNPPHVSLGYPWRALPDRAEVAAIVAGHAVFDAPVRRLGRFPADRRGRVVLYADLGDLGAARALAADLGWDDGLRPHCSLVRSADPAALDRAEEAALRHLPQRVVLPAVDVTIRVLGTWRQLGSFPLGG